MNKPITVARQEFIEAIIRQINTTPLPSFVVAGALREILPLIDKNI